MSQKTEKNGENRPRIDQIQAVFMKILCKKMPKSYNEVSS